MILNPILGLDIQLPGTGLLLLPFEGDVHTSARTRCTLTPCTGALRIRNRVPDGSTQRVLKGVVL